MIDKGSYGDGEQIEIGGTKILIEEGYDFIAVRLKLYDTRALKSLGEDIILEIIEVRIRAARSNRRNVEVETVRLYPMRSEAAAADEVERILEMVSKAEKNEKVKIKEPTPAAVTSPASRK